MCAAPRHANNHDDENTRATMAPNTNFQSNASEKVLWSRYSWVLIMVVHLAVGMRGPPTPIVMMMVMFFALRSDCLPHRSQKGTDPTQMASNMPDWSQAQRAHQQTKDGSSISNSLAHFKRAHDFSKMSASKTQSTKHSSPI